MGKYFSNDSNLLNYDISDDTTVDMTKVAMPDISHQETPLSTEKRSLLEPARVDVSEQQSLDEKINEIQNQNQEIAEEFNRIGRERVKQTFKSFDELEVLERLNQITFLLVEQNNRITNVENVLKSFGNINPQQPIKETLNDREMEVETEASLNQDISQLSAIDKHKLELEAANKPLSNEDLMNPQKVSQEISRISSGKVPSIPTEGLTDNSIKLEEIFPDRDPEAYQAAYKSLEDTEKRKRGLGYSKSPKGGLTGSNAGF